MDPRERRNAGAATAEEDTDPHGSLSRLGTVPGPAAAAGNAVQRHKTPHLRGESPAALVLVSLSDLCLCFFNPGCNYPNIPRFP